MNQSYLSMLSAIWAGLLPAALMPMLMACQRTGSVPAQPARPDAATTTRHDAGQKDKGPALLAWSESCLNRLQKAYGQAKLVDPDAANPILIRATDERFKYAKRVPGSEAGIGWKSSGKEYELFVADVEFRVQEDFYRNVPDNWVPVHMYSGAISDSTPESPREYFEGITPHPLTGPGPVKKGHYNAYRRHNHAVAQILVKGLTNPNLAAKLADIFEPVLEACQREGRDLTIIPHSTAPPEPPHSKPIWREPPLEITLSADGMPRDAKLHMEILSGRKYLDYSPDFGPVDLKKPKSISAKKPEDGIADRSPNWTCDIAWPFPDNHPCLTPKKWLFMPLASLLEDREDISICQLRATLIGKDLRKTIIHNFHVERHEHKIEISLDLERADDLIQVSIQRRISAPKYIFLEPQPRLPSGDMPVYRLINNSHHTVYTARDGTLEQWQDERWQPAYVKRVFDDPIDLSRQLRPMDWAYFAPILLENRPKPLPPGKYRYRLECTLMPPQMENVDVFELISEFTISLPFPPAGIVGRADAGSQPRDH